LKSEWRAADATPRINFVFGFDSAMAAYKVQVKITQSENELTVSISYWKGIELTSSTRVDGRHMKVGPRKQGARQVMEISWWPQPIWARTIAVRLLPHWQSLKFLHLPHNTLTPPPKKRSQRFMVE
jgi:hypothetical protein